MHGSRDFPLLCRSDCNPWGYFTAHAQAVLESYSVVLFCYLLLDVGSVLDLVTCSLIIADDLGCVQYSTVFDYVGRLVSDPSLGTAG